MVNEVNEFVLDLEISKEEREWLDREEKYIYGIEKHENESSERNRHGTSSMRSRIPENITSTLKTQVDMKTIEEAILSIERKLRLRKSKAKHRSRKAPKFIRRL